MKSIKINTAVNLTSGLQVSSGSVVIINEGYADLKNEKDGFIPSQIITSVYQDSQSYLDGKDPITGISDFNPSFYGLQMPVADYETQTAEDLLVNTVYNKLNEIYPNEVEIITL